MLTIAPIPAFDDNYIWLLRRPGATACAVVDPGDEDPVLERLAAEGLTLAAILVTHKHGDHVGGVAALKHQFPTAVVYGPAHEPIPHRDVAVCDGDVVELAALGSCFTVLGVPGHTEDHVAYLGAGALFCGDTLFAAGCGRVFSGTFEQLHGSLQRLAALAQETAVYCAHEYTEANLGFAQWVEPESAAVAKRLAQVRALRGRDLPTLPSSIGLERATNPFLRVAEPNVIAAAERWAGHCLAGGAAVFCALRTWKDRDYD